MNGSPACWPVSQGFELGAPSSRRASHASFMLLQLQIKTFVVVVTLRQLGDF